MEIKVAHSGNLLNFPVCKFTEEHDTVNEAEITLDSKDSMAYMRSIL